MAQKFKNGSKVKVKGSLFPVLLVRRYDSTAERYLCASGTEVSSYKILVKESDMSALTPEVIVAKTEAPAKD